MAVPGVAAAQATEDSVTGVAFIDPELCTGEPPFCFASDRYLFGVQSGRSGENPSGSVVFAHGERLGFTEDVGTVTCLAVSGQTASIGANFAGLGPPGDPRGPAHSAVIFVADLGGEGDDRLTVQDLSSGPGSAPAVCPPPLAGAALGATYPSSFYDDSITVTDAQPPLPTSKDQCKHGGWRNYPGFKNQGQCVAFVQRGPKA